MKRSRAKAVGLGLALFAGSAHAADDPPQVGRTAPAVVPALLPAGMRTGEWAASSSGDSDTLWLPARKSSTLRSAPTAGNISPAFVPSVSPLVPSVEPVGPSAKASPEWVSPVRGADFPLLGPRAVPGTVAIGPLPVIPAVPDRGISTPAISEPVSVPSAPTIPQPVSDPGPLVQPQPARVAVPGDWQPVPRPFPIPTVPPAETKPLPLQGVGPRIGAISTSDVPPEMPPPAPRPATPLPAPRPVDPQRPPATEGGTREAIPTQLGHSGPPGDQELPVAPPSLMVPLGVPVPGSHGTFGSEPIRISSDYPRLTDLLQSCFPGLGAPAQTTGNSVTNRYFVQAEYLMWWLNPQHIPVLATTSTNGGLGFLGSSGTQTLIGPVSLGDPFRQGIRLRAGAWFDDCGTCGIDGSFFGLGRQATSAGLNSATFPTITRPFFAPNFNSEFGEIVALPNFASGTLRVDSSSALWGFDLNLRHALCQTCDFRAEVFAGYRFLGLDESLQITESITALPGNTNDPAGTQVTVQDKFNTRNSFNGGQLGLAAERNWGRWSIDVRGSLALGDTHESVDIEGSQMRLRPGMTTPDVFTGGLLATGPNLGHFTRDQFSVVPEATINFGYWVTPNLKLYAGYNLLYWSNVVRPGDQIDRVVDVTLVPNPPAGVASSGLNRPQPTFKQTDLLVNGIQFGVAWRW